MKSRKSHITVLLPWKLSRKTVKNIDRKAEDLSQPSCKLFDVGEKQSPAGIQ